MKKKSWHLDRRTFLRGAGVCMALPWLEAMSADKSYSVNNKKRFFAGYFAYGVPMPKDDAPDRLKNSWYPVGEGKNYKLPDMHTPMSSLRNKVTFLSGFHNSKGPVSHQSGDAYLTCAPIKSSYDAQSISIDQYLAQSAGNETRYKSLVYSTMGGVHRQYRTSTLSFDHNGRPIPALNRPKEIFRRLFGQVTNSEKEALKKRGSILDLVMTEAKAVDRRLGKNDKEKMDEYLTSVREIEKMTEREISWLKTPKPKIDPNSLNLEVKPAEPREYLTVMYKLIALALKTDSSRFITYQVTPEENTFTEAFPTAVGISRQAHALSHETKDYTEVAKYIGFLNEVFYNFLKELDSVQEGEGTLLDNTICLYGSTQSRTHAARNFPIVLSGGKNLGLKHGHHYHENRGAFSNVLLTIARQIVPETQSFADSSGTISSLLT